MMGRHHATTGICFLAGSFSLVTLTGYATDLAADPRLPVVTALVCAAHFLRPDIDHDKAIASKCLGPLSEIESVFWREVSAAYYTATRAPADPVTPRRHRGLTHTPVGAVVFGLLAALAVGGSQSLAGTLSAGLSPWLTSRPGTALWEGWSGELAGAALALGAQALGLVLDACGAHPVVGVCFVGYCALLLSAAYAWRWRFVWGAGGLALGLACWPALVSGWAWIGVAAALGSYGHDLGDGCTTEGVPLRHPFAEQVSTKHGTGTARWADHGSPRWLRFRTGGHGENAFVTLLVTVAVVGVGAVLVWTATRGTLSITEVLGSPATP